MFWLIMGCLYRWFRNMWVHATSVLNYILTKAKLRRCAINLKLTLRASTRRMRTNAAPQPNECAESYGCEASLQILNGSASTGPVNDCTYMLAPKIVIIRGAVSPDILEIARTIPVRTPLLAVDNTIFTITFHFGIPSE